MNILHLSDIHFGRDRCITTDSFSRKSEIMDKLISTLASMSDEMKPDLVLVTGDIAWTGKISEFDEAYEWFQRLKENLGLDIGRFVFCPGNHDLNRKTATNFSEENLCTSINGRQKLDIQKCDELYHYKNAHKLETRFHNYNIFCEKMGMQPYSYVTDDNTTEYSYLIGSSEFTCGNERYQISCFNTAYLPYGKVLKDDQMFLGLPQIQSMIKRGVFSEPGVYRIALFHHADRYLHPNEQCEYDGRKASLPLLMSHVDLALCGHTETGGVPLLRTFNNGGNLLSGGATYYNDDHPNSFSLIHIEKDKTLDIRSYMFNGDQWVCFSSNKESVWKKRTETITWKNFIHDYPQFSFNIQVGDYVTELFSGHFATRIYCVSRDKYNVFYDNFINPARALDVFVDNNGYGDQPHRLGIRNSPGMWHTMEAQILLAEYHNFVKSHISGAHCAFHGLKNSEGKWVLQTSINVEKLSDQYKRYSANVNWYRMVLKIEDFYEVIFLFPESGGPTPEEEQTISYLKEIMEQGDLNLLYQDIMECWFFAHKKEELLITLQATNSNGTIAFHFERKLKCCIFGIEIDLGACDIYCIGAHPRDRNDIIRKINTWESGDRRTVEMHFPDGMNLWICPKYLSRSEQSDPSSGMTTFHMPPQAEIPLPETIKSYFIEY